MKPIILKIKALTQLSVGVILLAVCIISLTFYHSSPVGGIVAFIISGMLIYNGVKNGRKWNRVLAVSHFKLMEART